MKFSRYTIIAIIIALIILLDFVVPKKYFEQPIKSAFLVVAKPIEKAFTVSTYQVLTFFRSLSEIRKLNKENIELRKERDSLLAENIKLREVQQENEILKKELGFYQANPDFKLIAAQVIGRDPTNLLQAITLDKGEKDGIKKDMPVVSSGFLVGKISQTTWNTSKAFLITNPTSVINAMIQGSRATGNVRGQLGFGLVLEYVPQDIKINPGDKVITSGLGGGFPKGLLIGEVEQVIARQSEIFQSASLRPLVDFTKLEMVFIIAD